MGASISTIGSVRISGNKDGNNADRPEALQQPQDQGSTTSYARAVLADTR